MRDTANESAVFAAVSAKYFVLCLCGMMAMVDNGWLACSPDGVGIIDMNKLNFNQANAQEYPVDECGEKFSCLEIKTSVADSSLHKSIVRASVDVMKCTVGDTNFLAYIPQGHIGQLLHQMLVLAVNYCINVSAVEFWYHVRRSCLLSTSYHFYL